MPRARARYVAARLEIRSRQPWLAKSPKCGVAAPLLAEGIPIARSGLLCTPKTMLHGKRSNRPS
jgi:hypothetical protein